MVTAASGQHPSLTFWDLLLQITPLSGNLDSSICGLCATRQSHELVVTEQFVESFRQLPIVRVVKWLSCLLSGVLLDLDLLNSSIAVG